MATKEIVERLKSPVVIIQIITIISGLVIAFAPDVEFYVKAVAEAVVAIVSIFAGLNNPTDPDNF